MSRSLRPAFALLVCAAGLGCDRATKVAAESALRDRAPVPVLPGVLDLAYRENRDVAFDAFGRLSLHPSALVLVAFGVAAIAAVLVAWRRRRDATWPEHAAFASIVAGALGNVVDRLGRGYVVDFIHVHWWPVFNVADVLVVTGVALLLAVRGAGRNAALS